MPFLKALRDWIFYGHLYIALAAAGLGWMTVSLLRTVHPIYYEANTLKITAFLFTATLGVYTLHRLISFRKAHVIPTTKRYALVAKFPFLSLSIGLASLLTATVIIFPYLPRLWFPFLIALVLTGFYLIPPYPDWRRLRDIPYLKVVWVALAWALMTHVVPCIMAQTNGFCGNDTALNLVGTVIWRELIIRFLFTLTIALLFDGRDIQLDLANGVKTVANSFPKALKWLVTGALLICGFLSFLHSPTYIVPDPLAITLAAIYLSTIPIAWITINKKEEDWYAVIVNGLLLLPPLAVVIYIAINGGAGSNFS